MNSLSRASSSAQRAQASSKVAVSSFVGLRAEVSFWFTMAKASHHASLALPPSSHRRSHSRCSSSLNMDKSSIVGE